jgi:hypothetical protein
MLELQIIYELNSRNNPAWKHKRIGLSVTFLLTEYAPEQIFTLGKQINQELRNGSLFGLKSLLPLIPKLPVPHSLFRWFFIKEDTLITHRMKGFCGSQENSFYL